MNRGILPRALAGLLAAALLACPADAYPGVFDSPDFDTELFQPDGLSLEKDERDSLLEALAAIASNFPDDPAVDHDLREKALSLSLRISPLHHNSRAAHAALSVGGTVAPTAFFESATSVSEFLWNLSSKLGAPGSEPENRTLAPYLMELSLLLHPTPPEDRIAAYQRLLGGEKLRWGKFVKLQPDENPSNERARELRNRAVEDPAGMAATDSPPPPTNEPPTEIFSGEVVLPVITRTLSANATGEPPDVPPTLPASGFATLRIRPAPPESDEIESAVETIFGTDPDDPSSAGAGAGTIAALENASPPANPDRIAELAAALGTLPPPGQVIELGLSGETGEDPEGEITAVDLDLAGSLLLHTALSKGRLRKRLVFAGRLGEGETAESIPVLPALPPIDAINLARTMETEISFLALPADSHEALLSALGESGELDLLFRPQLLAVSTLDEARRLALGEGAAQLTEAGRAFHEIQVATRRLPLETLARNSRVRSRLEHILALRPDHLSARLLLEYGAEPGSP